MERKSDYVVAYELSKADESNAAIAEALRSLGAAQVLYNVWHLRIALSPPEVLDRLKPVLRPELDRLWIVPADPRSAVATNSTPKPGSSES